MATRAPALIIARGRGQVTVINQIGSVPRSCWAAVPSILDDVLSSAVAMTPGDSELLRQSARDTRDRKASSVWRSCAPGRTVAVRTPMPMVISLTVSGRRGQARPPRDPAPGSKVQRRRQGAVELRLRAVVNTGRQVDVVVLQTNRLRAALRDGEQSKQRLVSRRE